MYTLQDLRSRFETGHPQLVNRAGRMFPDLPREAREEAIAKTIGLTWKYTRRAWEMLNIHDDDDAWTYMIRCLFNAAKHVRAGRSVDRASRRDVYDRLARWTMGDDEVFVAGHGTPVPDQVAFRVDVLEDFFATLTDHQRMVARALMSGMTTTEVAHVFGVTPGAVSQFRRRFKDLMDTFFGE